jgi:Ca-activated chloride channel family protein
MTVGSPWFLALLLSLPIVAPLALRNFNRGRKSLALLTGRSPGDDFFGRYMIASFFGTALFCGFLFFAAIAAADFSWGRKPVEEDRSGLDVIFVLDVSRSMLAADTPPSRLAAAADIALGVMQGLPEARFGAVAFKGRGVPVVPVTEDHPSLEAFFGNAGSGIVAEPGTHLESGLDAALSAFPAGTERHRAVVLLSDGESLANFTGRSASRSGEEGVPIFAVGFGGKEGSSIRLPDGTLLTTGGKKPVVTRLNEGNLRTAADLSGGAYFSAREPGVVSRLVDEILDFAEARGATGFRLVSVRRYRGFLLAAFLCLAASVLVRSVRWKKED